MHRRLTLLLLCAATLLGAFAATPAAHANEGIIDHYEVAAQVTAEGGLDYSAEITPGADAGESFTIRLRTELPAESDAIHHFTITQIAASAGGNELPIQIDEQDDGIAVTIPTANLRGPITFSYHVSGVTHARPDGAVDFYWPVIQGVSLPIDRVSGTVRPGAPVREYGCQSGIEGSLGTCSLYHGGSEGGPDLQFQEARLAAGELVIGQLTYQPQTMPVSEQVSYRWTLDRAFGRSIANLLAALGALVLGGVLLMHLYRRVGADASGGEPTVIAGFDSVGAGEFAFRVRGGHRPGLVGTLADERVDPVDLTATVLDLATRGHLRITELPVADRYDPLDWRITRRQGGDELLGYEQTLVDAIGDGVLVSQIDRLHEVIPTLQGQLYDEVVARGWFNRRPDDVRAGFSRLGWGLVALATLALIGLLAFTSYGLLGMVLVALAGGFLALHSRMPARTALGTSALNGMAILAGQLQVQPTDELPAGQEYAELSKVLPYAVVLGGSDRWTHAIARADDDTDADSEDLDWFHAPADWHLSKLPESLDALVTSLAGRLFHR